MTKQTPLVTQVLAVIAELKPCTLDDIWRRGFPEHDRAQIARSINKLSTRGKIQRITPNGQTGVYTTMAKPTGMEVKPAPAPVKPMLQNITPARTHTSSGNYHEIPWRLSMPIRPGALDHEQWPSLRAGVRVPYAPAVLTIQ